MLTDPGHSNLQVSLIRAQPVLSTPEPKLTAAFHPGCPLDSPETSETCPCLAPPHTHEIRILGTGAATMVCTFYKLTLSF